MVLILTFVPLQNNGELAHLARALDWQSKGDGFDPRILHKNFIELKISSVYRI